MRIWCFSAFFYAVCVWWNSIYIYHTLYGFAHRYWYNFIKWINIMPGDVFYRLIWYCTVLDETIHCIIMIMIACSLFSLSRPISEYFMQWINGFYNKQNLQKKNMIGKFHELKSLIINDHFLQWKCHEQQ